MSIDLATADDILHKHTPYGELQRRCLSQQQARLSPQNQECRTKTAICVAAVLLIQATKQWHATHGPELPRNAREKQAYRDILHSWQRRIDDVPIEVLLHMCRLQTLS